MEFYTRPPASSLDEHQKVKFQFLMKIIPKYVGDPRTPLYRKLPLRNGTTESEGHTKGNKYNRQDIIMPVLPFPQEKQTHFLSLRLVKKVTLTMQRFWIYYPWASIGSVLESILRQRGLNTNVFPS